MQKAYNHSGWNGVNDDIDWVVISSHNIYVCSRDRNYIYKRWNGGGGGGRGTISDFENVFFPYSSWM